MLVLHGVFRVATLAGMAGLAGLAGFAGKYSPFFVPAGMAGKSTCLSQF